jgi:hypothetical protein
MDSNSPDPKPPSKEQGGDIEWREYLFFREELRHEDNLINQRLSWLIGSQAFLLGGFATLISASAAAPSPTLGKIQDCMITGLPIAGILGVVASYVTILAAVLHVHGVRKFVGDRYPHHMPSLQNWHTTYLRMGLFGPLVTPLIFLAFWVVILVRIR